MLARILIGVVALLGLSWAIVYGTGRGTFGELEAGGVPRAVPISPARIESESRARREAAEAIGVTASKQILFGDLHAHTTFSTDAYTFSLPMVGGEGAHPPADACDFARHCSALDFWSINDHAEELTPRQWRETVESIRQCNAVAGPQPDTVAFLGWEWTQMGKTPENHYGHKNVVLRHTDDANIPARPIGARPPPGMAGGVGRLGTLARGVAALLMGGRFHDWASFLSESEDVARCDEGAHVRDLPSDCIELASTPAELFRKLDEWGHDSFVIPHGTTWGVYTPPGASWDKQLAGAMHDPERQTMIEIYSGHGDSEIYQDWRATLTDEDGALVCPEPSADYLPSCWQAGEIIRRRCLETGEDAAECDRRAAEARVNYVAGGIPGHLTVPGARAEEWLDAGQCRDCREPSFNYRPASSAQYILALGHFDGDSDRPRRFRMGIMASSDNHFARPGTGYKEMGRIGMTESMGATRDPDALGPLASMIAPPPADPAPRSVSFEEAARDARGFQLFETERSIAFLLTGGLTAVHAEGRDRDSIWEAMQRREVYGTSGPRMLLWFELLNPPGSLGLPAPMGSEVALADAPIFRVRAVGSFEQKPGCPEDSLAALGDADLERLCKGECYHPGDRRRLVTRVEIVRVRPQIAPDEEIGRLIDDPWRRFACDPDPAGCSVTFSDPDYPRLGRGAVYYARAFEAARPAINAGNLRCTRDTQGRCTEVELCPGPRGRDDQCLAEHEPRAWSSPIFLDPPAATETH